MFVFTWTHASSFNMRIFRSRLNITACTAVQKIFTIHWYEEMSLQQHTWLMDLNVSSVGQYKRLLYTSSFYKQWNCSCNIFCSSFCVFLLNWYRLLLSVLPANKHWHTHTYTRADFRSAKMTFGNYCGISNTSYLLYIFVRQKINWSGSIIWWDFSLSMWDRPLGFHKENTSLLFNVVSILVNDPFQAYLFANFGESKINTGIGCLMTI